MYLIINCIVCEGTYGTGIICVAGVNIQQNPPKHVQLFKREHGGSSSSGTEGKRKALHHGKAPLCSDRTRAARCAIFPFFSRKPSIQHPDRRAPALGPASFDAHLLRLTQPSAHSSSEGQHSPPLPCSLTGRGQEGNARIPASPATLC